VGRVDVGGVAFAVALGVLDLDEIVELHRVGVVVGHGDYLHTKMIRVSKAPDPVRRMGEGRMGSCRRKTLNRRLTMRFLMLIRTDENAAAGGPSEAVMEEMGKLIDEMTKAGVLLDTAGLQPTSKATRVTTEHGRISVTDGPYAEAKEVVGGYLMLQVKSKDEAVEWANRFVRIHRDEFELTVEVREVQEMSE
jgi:hypothetical protein